MGRGNSIQTPEKAVIRSKIADGQSLRSLGREFNRTLSTIQQIRDSIGPRRQYSRKPKQTKVSSETIEQIRRFCKVAPWQYRNNWEQIKAQFLLNCSTRTLQRTCRKAGIGLYVCQSTQYRKQEHYADRFYYAFKHYHDTTDQWRSRLSIDESIFEQGAIQKGHCIREIGSGADPINRQMMDKRRKGWRLSVWGAVGYNYKSPLVILKGSGVRGAMKQCDYLSQVLDPHFGRVLEEFGAIAPGPVECIEDGNGAHGLISYNNVCAKWRRDHGVTMMVHPSVSPDMQVIEDCWRYVKDKLRLHVPTSLSNFEALSIKLWDEMPLSFVNSLFDHYPDRIHNLYEVGGKDTKY
jgi:DDE superfamily endonuclease